jgi:hypothetical protein
MKLRLHLQLLNCAKMQEKQQGTIARLPQLCQNAKILKNR